MLVLHPRIATLMLGIVGAAIFVASFRTGVRSHLPGESLGWVFGLQLLRAVVALALLAGVAIVLTRAWSGRWPSRLSTGGVEFDNLASGSRDLRQGADVILHILRELNHGKDSG